jgi:hypothetical protein
MKISKTNVVLSLLLIFSIILMGIQQCNLNNTKDQVSDYKAWEKFMKAEIDSFKNKLNQTVVEAKVAQVADEERMKELSEQIFQLNKKDERQIKEIQSLIRVIQNAKLDTTFITFRDSTGKPVVRDPNDTTKVFRKDVVIPPMNFKDSTKNYQIDGTVLLSGVRINSLVLPDTASFRVVEKKEPGLFTKRELTIQGIHSNPLFQTTGMQMVQKRGDKPTRWQRWIKPTLTFVIGSFLTYKVLKE